MSRRSPHGPMRPFVCRLRPEERDFLRVEAWRRRTTVSALLRAMIAAYRHEERDA